MPFDLRRNIEIKAKCKDLDAARSRTIGLGAVEHGLLEQTDTYFHAPHGRLKIRQQTGRPAQLIGYARADIESARESNFQLIEIADAAAVISVLTRSLGVRGEVRKIRELLIWNNVRIHLDRVERLGTFIEFEAMIDAENAEQESRHRLEHLCNGLQIAPDDRIAQSYSDLLGI